MSNLSEVGIILVNNNRSRAYLQRMRFHGLRPNFALVLVPRSSTPTPGQQAFDTAQRATLPEAASKVPESETFSINAGEHCIETLLSLGTEFREFTVDTINDPVVVDALANRPEPYWICSPPGGSILKAPLFSIGKRYLHVHPGRLPEFRGSTTIYYSLLAEGTCGATAIFLDEQIDTGPVISSKEFPPPSQDIDPDYLFDPLIRSELLVEVLLGYRESGIFPTSQQSREGKSYYIIHPVLKHIARLAIEGGAFAHRQ